MNDDANSDGNDAHPADAHPADARPDGGSTDRPTVDLPETIRLPRLLDFYELQTAEHTRIFEFYEHLRDGQLTTTECRDCGELHYPPRIVCPECHGDDLAWTDLPHDGELFAFSAVRAGAPMGMADDVPFVTGIVDLGPVRLSARIDGAEYDDLAIGDPVCLRVVEIDGPADHERVFYRFHPA